MNKNKWRVIAAVWFAAVLAVGVDLLMPAAPVQAQSGTVTGGSVPDITGDGSAHDVNLGAVRSIQVICPSGNSAAVRVVIKGATVSSTQGAAIPAGGGILFPPMAPNERYPGITYLAGSGDKLQLIWVQ